MHAAVILNLRPWRGVNVVWWEGEWDRLVILHHRA